MATRLRARNRSTMVAIVVVLAIAAAACSSSEEQRRRQQRRLDHADHGGHGSQRAVRVTFALPAETSGGWCLQEGQLAISGIQVARAIYDTLTVPDVDEKYMPFLAESVTPNADCTVWTIKLRSGIKFHDGTDARREGREEQPRRVPRASTRRGKPLLFTLRVRDLRQGRRRSSTR